MVKEPGGAYTMVKEPGDAYTMVKDLEGANI